LRSPESPQTSQTSEQLRLRQQLLSSTAAQTAQSIRLLSEQKEHATTMQTLVSLQQQSLHSCTVREQPQSVTRTTRHTAIQRKQMQPARFSRYLIAQTSRHSHSSGF